MQLSTDDCHTVCYVCVTCVLHVCYVCDLPYKCRPCSCPLTTATQCVTCVMCVLHVCYVCVTRVLRVCYMCVTCVLRVCYVCYVRDLPYRCRPYSCPLTTATHPRHCVQLPQTDMLHKQTDRNFLSLNS